MKLRIVSRYLWNCSLMGKIWIQVRLYLPLYCWNPQLYWGRCWKFPGSYFHLFFSNVQLITTATIITAIIYRHIGRPAAGEIIGSLWSPWSYRWLYNMHGNAVDVMDSDTEREIGRTSSNFSRVSLYSFSGKCPWEKYPFISFPQIWVKW